MASFREEGPPRPAFLLGGLKTLTRSVKLGFCDKVLHPDESSSAQWKLSASDRMRQLDDIRKHAPLETECTDLNIPNDRLDLHRKQDILFLCGGCCGVRFTSDEMSLIDHLRSLLDPLWDAVNRQFQGMDSAERKRVLSGGPYTREMLAAEGAALAPEDAGSDSDGAIAYHIIADDYVRAMHRLQTLIKAKQSTIQRGEGSQQLAKFEKDPDSNMGKALPDWLTLLLTKYQAKLGNDTTGTAQSLKAGVTVGKLATFISSCVVGSEPCHEEEWSAVSQLLHASNDTDTVFTLDGRVLDKTGARQPQPKPQGYWASRIFNFLSSLSELKSMPKGKVEVE
jgi:hypothetical protein